jgi:hypothetical protein
MSLSDGHEPLDVSPILKDLGVLEKDANCEVPRDRSVGNAFLCALNNKENVKKCVDALFPTGASVDNSFFVQLDEFHRWIGVSSSGDEAMGLVWSEAIGRLSKSKQQDQLNVFARLDSRNFFEYSRSVWVVARDNEFDADFLVGWFVELLKAVETDMMQEDVWKTIRTACVFKSQTAIRVLYQYLLEPNDRRNNIASFMLGVLRSQSLDAKLSGERQQIDDDYQNNSDPSLRAVFNRSWVTTARERELTEVELNQLISRGERSIDDLDNIVIVVCRLVVLQRLPLILLTQAVQWVDKTISPALSSNAKYNVVNAASSLFGGSNEDDWTSHSKKWILKIQPIHFRDEGTWNCIEKLLCDVLTKDLSELSSIFFQLSSTSAREILHLMKKREFSHFLQELAKHKPEPLVAQLSLSHHTPTRKLGLFIFNELSIDEFPSSELQSSDLKGIQLLFYEAQRTYLSPNTVGKVLAAVVSVIDKFQSEFQGEILDELRLQCHNFPGGCRKELERLAMNSPLVTTAMKEVADYFESLKRAHESGVNAMEVTGARKAAREQRRRFNKQVSEGAKSASSLLRMMKHVSLIYGMSASQFINRVLTDSNPLFQSSYSMEIPVVDFFDPEEMALRRLHASKRISQLLGDHEEESEAYDEC